MVLAEMFKNSKIVVAHTDDEILWFSSIIDKVDKIIICFLDVLSHPNWTIGRHQSLTEHPFKNITCLKINESEVYNGANWENPVINDTGIEISNNGFSDKKYIENYHKLKENLKIKLTDCSNVFTHNPWGDYGNEEHIQVYRIIKQLQTDLKYNLWFSNYCSNQSFNLMLNYISSYGTDYITLKTNKKIGNQIKQIYQKNDCWTWFQEWVWFNEESFIEDKNNDENRESSNHIFPLNIMKIKLRQNLNPFKRFYRRLKSGILKYNLLAESFIQWNG